MCDDAKSYSFYQHPGVALRVSGFSVGQRQGVAGPTAVCDGLLAQTDLSTTPEVTTETRRPARP
eukprot:8821517-Lingulodinium_polyedra.AAC.1